MKGEIHGVHQLLSGRTLSLEDVRVDCLINMRQSPYHQFLNLRIQRFIYNLSILQIMTRNTGMQ